MLLDYDREENRPTQSCGGRAVAKFQQVELFSKLGGQERIEPATHTMNNYIRREYEILKPTSPGGRQSSRIVGLDSTETAVLTENFQRREAGVDVNGDGIVGVPRVAAAQDGGDGDAAFFALAKNQLIAFFEPIDGQLQIP